MGFRCLEDTKNEQSRLRIARHSRQMASCPGPASATGTLSLFKLRNLHHQGTSGSVRYYPPECSYSNLFGTASLGPYARRLLRSIDSRQRTRSINYKSHWCHSQVGLPPTSANERDR